MKTLSALLALEKAEILSQRVPVARKRKKRRPHGWHRVLRQKRKASRRARGITLRQRRKR